MENHYKYEVDESYFKGANMQTTKVSCLVTVTCESGNTTVRKLFCGISAIMHIICILIA